MIEKCFEFFFRFIPCHEDIVNVSEQILMENFFTVTLVYTYRPKNSLILACCSINFCCHFHMNIFAKVNVNDEPIAPPVICL